MRTRRPLLITTGDPDGIGFEVAAKALLDIGPLNGRSVVLFRSNQVPTALLRQLAVRFPIPAELSLSQLRQLNVSQLRQLNVSQPHAASLVHVVSKAPAAKWVVAAARLCAEGAACGMVTGPLSKTGAVRSGASSLGHTELLHSLVGGPPPNMGFVGKRFNVVLATGHLPLRRVPSQITLPVLRRAIQNANQLRLSLAPKVAAKPIGVLGLNPHCGEWGLIGDEEHQTIIPALKILSKEFPLKGPLVPDALFSPERVSQFSVVVALYHDQGLIPFKAAHRKQGGVHVTLGLPFVRTSVDHGTAKDIFNRNIANYQSMKRAIHLALTLSRRERF